jgi:hypothetical protein
VQIAIKVRILVQIAKIQGVQQHTLKYSWIRPCLWCGQHSLDQWSRKSLSLCTRALRIEKFLHGASKQRLHNHVHWIDDSKTSSIQITGHFGIRSSLFVSSSWCIWRRGWLQNPTIHWITHIFYLLTYVSHRLCLWCMHKKYRISY